MMSRFFAISLLLFTSAVQAAFDEYKPSEKALLSVDAYLMHDPEVLSVEVKKIYAFDQVTKKTFRLNLKKNKNARFSSQMDLDHKRFAKTPTFTFGTDEKISSKLIILPVAQKKGLRVALFDDEFRAMTFADDPVNKVQLDESQGQEWLRRRAQMIEQNRMQSETEVVLQRERLKKEFEHLSAKQKSHHEKEAKTLAEKGDEAYKAEKYLEAAALYQKSTLRDPNQDRVYYKYGVALYKTDDFIRSLAALSVAEGDVENKAEYYYYIGLNNMKLRDFEKAYDSFRIARDENDPTISSIAAFLAGNIAFQTQKYDNAKEDFQYCLDNSKDTAMDKQAEQMLEQIDQAEAFLAQTKQVFRYSIFLGYSYDQNILNIAQQGTPTDNAGYRWNYGVTGYYKIKQTTTSELGLQASYSDTYSTDKSGAASNTLQAADPLLLNIGLPYRRSFEAFEKQMMWSVTPSLSTVTMNAEGKGRQKILESKTVDADLMYQHNIKLISAYRIQLNSDESFLSSSGSDDDQGGTRITLGTNQSYALNPAGTQRLAGDFSIVRNSAKGRNSVYDKNALSAQYSFPAPANISGSLKAEFATAAYRLNSSDRSDSVWTYTLNGTKSIHDAWSANFSTQFVNSGSSLSTNKYDKYIFSLMLTYAGSISKK